MTIGEKVAYLKGLTEGLAPADSSEMKLINKIIEILDEVAEELEEIRQVHERIVVQHVGDDPLPESLYFAYAVFLRHPWHLI